MFFEDSSLDRVESRSLGIKFEESSFRALKSTCHLEVPGSVDAKGTKLFPLGKPSECESASGKIVGSSGVNLSSKTVVVPPPCPSYYEASSSFLSDKLPLALINSVLFLLQAQNIDFSFISSKSKIECVWYTETNASCTFNIRIFKSPNQKARHLVEFQRRTGCVVAFRRIFH
jgi:hypothetical protein